ncbi:MAG TPA: MraY family glycosyltransferase [Thermoleophilaceae bacterium]|nr:MraY family glycosyltransferase [Thermoleophilaceae bacterium]
MHDLDAAFGAFALALATVWVATPIAGRIAWRIGAIDLPRERGLHMLPTPRLGGLALLVGIVASGLVFLEPGKETYAILGGAVVIALVGAADDVLELGADVKLAGQGLAALVPVLSGVRVETFTLPFLGHIELGTFLPYVVTVLGIVAVMNMVNFIDGVDGLAAGVCTIAGLALGVIALSLDRTGAGLLAVITAGGALGYLRHGFHPATIFLGDSGSNLLGYLLATVAVGGALKTNAVVALVFPLVILAVPILDSGFVIAKRVKYRKPVHRADSEHFHHRFARIGFSQKRTVLYLYAWTLSLAALALALRFVPYSQDDGTLNPEWAAVIGGFFLAAFAASIYLVLVLEILKFRRFRERQLRRQADTGEIEALSDSEIEAEIEREVETGEFEAV